MRVVPDAADGPPLQTGESDSDDFTRSVTVPLRRLDTWLAGFRARHGEVSVRPVDAADPQTRSWLLRGQDGEGAVVEVPPWLTSSVTDDRLVGQGSTADDAEAPILGVLLLRRGGYAVGVFRGDQQLQAKVGKRHIHGRTAAGGWSQRRYARRRANQADEIADGAAAAFARVVAPHAALLGVLVSGGDRALLTAARTIVDATHLDPAQVQPGREPWVEPTSHGSGTGSADGSGSGHSRRSPGRGNAEAPATLSDGPPDGAASDVTAPEVSPGRTRIPPRRDRIRTMGAVLGEIPHVHLGIGTPTREVLAGVPDRVLAVRIRLSQASESEVEDD